MSTRENIRLIAIAPCLLHFQRQNYYIYKQICQIYSSVSKKILWHKSRRKLVCVNDNFKTIVSII